MFHKTKEQEVKEILLAMLAQSDWTQLRDTDLSESKQQEWAEYRKALRSLYRNYDPEHETVFPPSPN